MLMRSLEISIIWNAIEKKFLISSHLMLQLPCKNCSVVLMLLMCTLFLKQAFLSPNYCLSYFIQCVLEHYTLPGSKVHVMAFYLDSGSVVFFFFLLSLVPLQLILINLSTLKWFVKDLLFFINSVKRLFKKLLGFGFWSLILKMFMFIQMQHHEYVMTGVNVNH